MTLLRCDEIFNYRFLVESDGERIWKISQYLVTVQEHSIFFFDSQCIVVVVVAVVVILYL